MRNKQVLRFKVSSTFGLQIFCHSVDESRFIDIMEAGQWLDRECRQRFAWMSDFIAFFPYGSFGSYWIEVYEKNTDALDDRTYFAVAVPLRLTQQTAVQFCGTDDMSEPHEVLLESGEYRLVFQERFMTQPEIDILPVVLIGADTSEDANDPRIALGPRCCTFTFVPVEQRRSSTRVA
jgi:hypothetical protein